VCESDHDSFELRVVRGNSAQRWTRDAKASTRQAWGWREKAAQGCRFVPAAVAAARPESPPVSVPGIFLRNSLQDN
jgi:hypothetical protein